MAANRTTMSALLKEFYLPGVRKTLNDTVFLLSQVEKRSDKVEGKQIVQSIRVGRNQGIGARSEEEALPTAGQQGIANVRSNLKYNYGRIQVSGPLMRSSTSDRGGFARPLETETRGVTTDLKKDVNRQLYGDGTGKLVTFSAAGGVAATMTSTQYRQLQPGIKVDLMDAANTVKQANATVSAVNYSTKTVTLSAGTTAATDYLVRTGSYGDELTGLSTIVSNSILYGLDPANYKIWQGIVLANGGTPRAPAEELFYGGWQESNLVSGDEINLWITDASVHRLVAKNMMSLKRFPNTNELSGGYSGLDMSSVGQARTGGKTVTMTYDVDCPAGTAFGLTTDRLQFQRASDWEFMDEDGAVLNRVPNVDAYEATLFLYADLVTDSRASHVKITDLLGDTSVTPFGEIAAEEEAKAKK